MIRMTRILAVLLLASLLLFSLAACTASASATSAAPTTTVATTAAATTAASAARFPVTVKNAAGQDITIDEAPQAIIATSVWSGEMLLDLVAPERITALSAWGDDPVLSAAADRAKAVAGRVATTKPEEIVALQPDLVIIDTFSDPDGSLTKTLGEAGIVVLQLSSPTDFPSILATVTTLAAATGSIEDGREMVAEINATLQTVSDKIAAIPADKRLTALYYEDQLDANGKSNGMLCAYGEGSTFSAIAAAAGLTNVCNAPNYSAVSKEKIVGDWQPDILVVPAMYYDESFKGVDDQGAKYRAAIESDPLLKTLPAVQSRRILALADRYRGSTSQYMVQAVVDLAAAAYPEAFQ